MLSTGTCKRRMLCHFMHLDSTRYYQPFVKGTLLYAFYRLHCSISLAYLILPPIHCFLHRRCVRH